MRSPQFSPPWFLRDGLAMTLFTAWAAPSLWDASLKDPQPPYQSTCFEGYGEVPLFGWLALPSGRVRYAAKGTIIGTYGITGTLDNQWFLQILGRKAFAQGYAVVLFDWRGHGKTAELSPTLTADGLYEGKDFIQIAAQAKAAGCPPPFWFVGFSLGGQLALWGIREAQALDGSSSMGITADEIGGGAVICPSLDSNRSLSYLERSPLGRYLEQAIAQSLKQLAQQIASFHPGCLDPKAIARVKTIRGFDQELVIPRLGFTTVQDYYSASSPLPFLPSLEKPTLLLYAADDPMFDPTIVDDLKSLIGQNPTLDIRLTQHGGHVGYYASRRAQQAAHDPDPWWAWNRVLDWLGAQALNS